MRVAGDVFPAVLGANRGVLPGLKITSDGGPSAPTDGRLSLNRQVLGRLDLVQFNQHAVERSLDFADVFGRGHWQVGGLSSIAQFTLEIGRRAPAIDCCSSSSSVKAWVVLPWGIALLPMHNYAE